MYIYIYIYFFFFFFFFSLPCLKQFKLIGNSYLILIQQIRTTPHKTENGTLLLLLSVSLFGFYFSKIYQRRRPGCKTSLTGKKEKNTMFPYNKVRFFVRGAMKLISGLVKTALRFTACSKYFPIESRWQY